MMTALPQTFHLALATCAEYPELSPDDAVLVPELAQVGVTSQAIAWNAPDVHWDAFDAVLLRSTWDYMRHESAFRRWVDCLPVPLLNERATVAWNIDKRYLQALAGAGITIVPTRCVPGNALSAALAEAGEQVCIVKPAVSASAWQTLRGQPGELCFMAEVDALPRDRDYLVQPFLAEIETAGEWSLIFFDGGYSHAVRKFPAAGDFRVQPSKGGRAERGDPDSALITQAAAVLQTLPGLGLPVPAYARVDGVVVDGGLMLMELELIEPGLHLRTDPDAARRLARVVRNHLEQLARSRPR